MLETHKLDAIFSYNKTLDEIMGLCFVKDSSTPSSSTPNYVKPMATNPTMKTLATTLEGKN